MTYSTICCWQSSAVAPVLDLQCIWSPWIHDTLGPRESVCPLPNGISSVLPFMIVRFFGLGDQRPPAAWGEENFQSSLVSLHFTPTPIQKTALFCMFSLFNFSFIFPRGSADLTPFAPMCGRPWARLTGVPNRPTDMLTTLHLSRHK